MTLHLTRIRLTVYPFRCCGAAALVVVVALAAAPALAQDVARDTSDRGTSSLVSHSPQGAIWRAAAVPGWGQYYNGQYYKIPIVWAGLGGLAASAVIVNREYLLYRHAYHFLANRDPDGNPLFPEYEQDFEELTEGIPRERALQLTQEFRQGRDNLRRNRDLLYIGIGLFYGLTILDAYVNAHLLEFDVGEDLSVAVRPVPGGFSASLQMDR